MKTQEEEIEKILKDGVKKLKKFGFEDVNKNNILSDEVYFFFLTRFTNSLRGKNKRTDKVIDKLLNKK
jgi:hypothetical protein